MNKKINRFLCQEGVNENRFSVAELILPACNWMIGNEVVDHTE
jgi:hypothetical protein